MDKVLSKTIVKNGIKTQSVIAMEECAELIKEISKHIRGIGDKEHLVEEMADVYIILKQLKMMYCITNEDVDKWLNKKVARLEGRLGDEFLGDNLADM